MDKYTKKKDWLGNTTYYDSHGREIGKEEKTWLGDTVIRNSDGSIFGKIQHDSLGREIVKTESKGIFDTPKTLINSSEPEDWEYCDKCGEWDGGDDDCECNQ